VVDALTFRTPTSPELGVETWELDQYIDPLSNDPPIASYAGEELLM
jgi:hypothetical protein